MMVQYKVHPPYISGQWTSLSISLLRTSLRTWQPGSLSGSECLGQTCAMSFVSISCSTPCGDSSWQPGSADGSLCLSVCGPLRRSHRHAQYGTQVLKDCSARRRTLLYPRGLQPERPLVHAMSVITGNLKQAAISHDATLARTPLHLASDQSDWLTKKRLLYSLLYGHASIFKPPGPV